MNICVHGLGRMGMQIARKLAEDGHTVIAHNRSRDKIDEAAGFGAIAAYEKQDVIKLFADQRVVLWLMLPAEVVDQEIDDWLKLLPKNSVVVDGGNSDFRKTKLLNEKLRQAGIMFADVGTSGGVWGYQNGFCMMAGSNDKETFDAIEPALRTLAAPGGAYHHFGPSGAGHFVKMTHNAIEYGMMQSLAEGYNVLKSGPYDNLDLAAAGDVWQHHSVITSWLNELSRDALRENPELDGISGVVAETGETRWTLEIASQMDLPTPAIQAAFDVRKKSQEGEINFATKLLAAMRNKFGGHDLNQGNEKR